MAAVRRQMCQLCSIPGFGALKSKVSSSSSSFQRAIFYPFPVYGARHFSQLFKSNGKHLFLVDTLALVRRLRLEGEGVPSKQAENITAATTEVSNDSLENESQSLVSKGKLQKIETMQECNLSKFKVEVQSPQGHHFSLLQHEIEKLRNDIEKMRIELRKIREPLSNQNAETNNLTNRRPGQLRTRAHRRQKERVDKKLQSLKADLGATCIGALVFATLVYAVLMVGDPY